MKALFTAVPGKPSIYFHFPADKNSGLISSKMFFE